MDCDGPQYLKGCMKGYDPTTCQKKKRHIKKDPQYENRFFGMSTGAFWHVDGCILACRRVHFGMSTGAF